MPLVALSENGVTFWSDPAEQETLDLLRGICAECIPLIAEFWGLPLPRRCRVYVMTKWSTLLFHAAPWPLALFYFLTVPIWRRNVLKIWTLAAGLTIRYRRGPAIGVKPVRLWVVKPDSIGGRIFYKIGDSAPRLRNVVCHEMTHAFTAHLNLPLWLNEGVAMITVDKFLQRETVQASTLQTLRAKAHITRPGEYAGLAQMSDDAQVYAYVRGYWVTRYLFETSPALLQRLLAKRRKPQEIESEIARSLGLSLQTFWLEIDARVTAHFTYLEAA